MRNTVLIVDDDVNARIIAETLLRTRGLRVQSAVDGVSACEIVRRESPAVVVLDLALEGMNGFEIIRALRARFGILPPPEQPCIIAVSQRSDHHVERFALRLGADAFLHKPMAPREFVTTVERLLVVAAERNEMYVNAG
jgi:DNA-binding response OmpR family regulator